VEAGVERDVPGERVGRGEAEGVRGAPLAQRSWVEAHCGGVL